MSVNHLEAVGANLALYPGLLVGEIVALLDIALREKRRLSVLRDRLSHLRREEIHIRGKYILSRVRVQKRLVGGFTVLCAAVNVLRQYRELVAESVRFEYQFVERAPGHESFCLNLVMVLFPVLEPLRGAPHLPEPRLRQRRARVVFLVWFDLNHCLCSPV